MDDYDNIRNALSHIDPHDRDTWFRMGAAIKDELGENGFEMWDEWSRQSDNYKSNDAQSVWKSIKTGHIRIGTLFKTARENGYRPERPYTPPTPEALAQRAEQAKARQLAEQQRIEQAHAKAQKTAYGIWHNAHPANSSHAYAQSKGLSAAALSGLRQNEYQGKKQLIIPLYADKKLVNVQTIDEQGNKSFLSGGQKKGAYALIGDFNQRQGGIILAEGYATGASVHQATGKPVIIAFDAGNLKSVSEKLIHTLERDIPVYFAADNDPNQTGLHKAQAAAEVWGERAKIILPQFEAEHISTYRQQHGADKLPTDFNDLHRLAGIESVKQQFNPQERTMTQQKFELGQAVQHENPHLREISLVVGKSENAYLLLGDEPVRSPYLQTTDGAEFQAATSQAWQTGLVYENKNAEQAYQTLLSRAAKYPEYEMISKDDFFKAFGQQPEREQDTEPQHAANRQELSMEDKLKNNYWRVANGYDPLPEETPHQQPAQDKPQEIRTEWGDFPPVVSNGKLGELKNEPEYQGAKSGDVAQSIQLVDKLLKDETVQELKQMIGNRQPVLVPVQSEEVSGKNRIPHTAAHALAAKLGLEVDNSIYQDNTAKRTGSGIYHRYVSPPEFTGEVKAGQDYLIIDDTLSVGGTIAALKGYIENRGGKVIGSTVMTAHDNKVDIAIKPNMLQSLAQKEGLNEYWRKEFGYGVDKLTQQEAGHLRKPTLEQIQERVQAARESIQHKEIQHDTATTQPAPTEQQPVHTTPEINGTGVGGTETAQPGSNQDFGTALRHGTERESEINFRQPENELPPITDNLRDDEPPPYYPPEYWAQLSTEPPTPDSRQPENPTAASEQDAAVSFSEKETDMDKYEAQMPNSIEYAGRQITPPKPEFDTEPPLHTESQEKPTAERPPVAEPETAAPVAEKSKPVTGLEYEIPAYLQNRYIVADTQKYRIGEHQFGEHSLKYLSQDNAKTVLFEDKGKTLHTARNDQQTVQDMLAVAQAKGWDSINISGSQEFKRQMWLEAESRGIATKGYTPSPEDLAVLEKQRNERSTNSIAEAERLKQMAAVPEQAGSTIQTIPTEAVKAADMVKAHAHRAAQTPPSQTAKNEYERKLAALPDDQQKKARFYERMGLEVLRRMQPESEAREKAAQALYENQSEKIRDGKFHAPDPMQTQAKHEHHHEKDRSQSRDWDMER